MSDILWPHGLQHTRLPCPSLSPRVCSKSCPLSRSCHPTISSSVSPFSTCPQSSPASRCFPVSQLFTSGSHRIRALASASVLTMSIYGWFSLGLAILISLLSNSQKSSPAKQSLSIILWYSVFFMVQHSPLCMTTGKTLDLSPGSLFAKWCLCFLVCCLVSSFFFFFSSKEQESFHLVATVTIYGDFGAKENKVCPSFHCFPIYLPWSDGARCHYLSFLNVEF